jgi:hypothetical protein
VPPVREVNVHYDSDFILVHMSSFCNITPILLIALVVSYCQNFPFLSYAVFVDGLVVAVLFDVGRPPHSPPSMCFLVWANNL